MKTRTMDPAYDLTKARVEALSSEQFARVLQRVRSVKAIVPRGTWLLAINSSIDLELSGKAPTPTPCPPFNSQEMRFAALLADSCFVEKVMNPKPPF